jgi:hypothetical protein
MEVAGGRPMTDVASAAGPVVSVGAGADLEALNRRIEAAVASRECPHELATELDHDADALGLAVDALRGASQLSIEPPVGSPRRLSGRAVTMVKRTMRVGLRWYTRWLVSQVHTFAANTVTTAEAMAARLEDQGRQLRQLRAEPGRARPGSPAPGGRGDYLRSFAAAPGVVADLSPGAVMLAPLRAAGIDAYAPEAGAGDPTAHLAGVAEGSLGGAFCSGLVPGLDPPGVTRLFAAAARAIATGGVLVVETLSSGPGTASPPHPGTLAFVAEGAGFRRAEVLSLAGRPAAERRALEPGSSVDRLAEAADANFERLEEAVFGPRDHAVVARR